jgi:tetratricopeptide (TPR) repeat protein
MAQPTWHTLKCDAVRWRRLNKPQQAIACLVQAIQITEQAPDLARETGALLNYLADTHLQEGELEQAEAAIRRALQVHLGLPGPERGLEADDLMILARVLSRQARRREAYEAGRKALASFRRQPGAQKKFIAQIEGIVQELRHESEQAADVEPKRIRAETDSATDRPRH